MSFVYIDSQGREVKIPSVDAVRLRIELGAIKDQTRLLDSNTGKWAPAAEHEIYRTLKRELMEAEQGFVAPPPPSMNAEESRGSAGPAVSEAEEVAATQTAVEDEPAEDAEVDGADAVADETLDGWDEVAVAPLHEDDAEETAPAVAPTASGGGAEGPTQESFVASVEDELMGGLGDDHGASTLDDAALELEPTLADSFAGAAATSFGDEAEPEPAFADPSAAGWGGDEPAEDDLGWPAEAIDGSGEFDGAEASGDWVGGSDALDAVWETAEDHRPEAESPSSDDPADDLMEEVFGVAEPAGGRGGGAPPQRKLTRARTPGMERIVGIVGLVVVLGGALFFGMRFLAPTLGIASGEPEILMPPLDRELVPRMRQLAGRASGRMAQDMLALPEARAVPEEPSEDWLAGIYLAGASGYPDVPAYWTAVRDWVEVARNSENALFREALLAQLDTANLAASDSVAIRDRALAGFQAASTDRRVVYDQMQQVAERSLVLHEFLVANEDQVTYEPAGSGVSRDPVLEAVPSSEALGEEMWEMVGSITNAMDALGYLDRIDTERLLGVFLEKLEATAIR